MGVTIVSCYYRLNNSKHTLKEYEEWILNLIFSLNYTNVILFTCKNDEKYIRNLFQKNNKISLFIVIQELDDLWISNSFENIWNHQYSMDKQKETGRSIDCYKLWNSKFKFLEEAIHMNPYNSNKFIWNDIGNVRNKNMKKLLQNYPKEDNISHQKLDIILLRAFQDPTQCLFQNEVHFSGSIFGGGKDILLELSKLYYYYFELYIKNELFIGCDQQIISTLFMTNKKKFNIIYPSNNNIDPWFFLYEYYSMEN